MQFELIAPLGQGAIFSCSSQRYSRLKRRIVGAADAPRRSLLLYHKRLSAKPIPTPLYTRNFDLFHRSNLRNHFSVRQQKLLAADRCVSNFYKSQVILTPKMWIDVVTN